MTAIDFSLPYASSRAPVMGRNVVSTSQSLASQAGMQMMLKGGNAIDAILAAAMTLAVVEPSGNGLGSDAFAILWDGEKLHGLNSSGRSPEAWTPERFKNHQAFPDRGWDSVTVPGAVAAWVELSAKFGKLPFETLAEPAIGYARHGFLVTPKIAGVWARAAEYLHDQPGFGEHFMPGGSAPKAGELFRSEHLAKSLELIAQTRGEAFYRGALAETMTAHSKAHDGGMTMDDFCHHTADWVDLISMPFSGARVHEIPPNGQGIAALMGLGMIEAAGFDGADADDPHVIHLAIEAMKLAFTDVFQYVGDPQAMKSHVNELLDPAYLAQRAKTISRSHAGEPRFGALKPGGTVYLAAADADGRMVSYIQSNYMGFGSGVVVPGTGISLQNRGSGFTLEPGHVNQVGPRKRPFHTIIPGFATDAGGGPLMAFGVMGGFMQAQGHVQMALRVLHYGQNSQAAADAPRWRLLTGRKVSIEPGMSARTIETLRGLGHDLVIDEPGSDPAFGGAQLILRTKDGYIAGSDPRKDGQAVAF